MSKSQDELQLERELFVRAMLPTIRGEGAARLAAMLEPLEVPAGTFLFHAGEPPEQFFFVVEGQVAMEAEGHPTWTFGPRSMVGMVDMNAWRPHRRACRTLQPTRLLAGRSRQWLELLDDDPIMGDSAIQGFASVLHSQLGLHGHLLAPPPIIASELLVPPLPLYQKALVLRDTALLRRASTQAIVSLAQVAEELVFDAGEAVFALGRAERALYVVASGVVALGMLGSDRRVSIGPRSVLGAAAALSGNLGGFSALAETSALVLRIREEDYYDQSDEHPELMRAAMAYMAIELERLMDLVPPTT